MSAAAGPGCGNIPWCYFDPADAIITLLIMTLFSSDTNFEKTFKEDSHMSFRILSRRAAGITAAAIFLFAALAVRPALAAGPETKKADKANYDLASRWQSAKVGKLVFDTSVSPHWLETGDRFW